MASPLDASVTFRLTGPEKLALEALAARRSSLMAERGEVPDDTVNGYLRAVIRRDAKEAGIELAVVSAPLSPKRPLRGGRRQAS